MIIEFNNATAGDIAQATTMVAAAIIGAIFMIQKLLKGFKETATESNVMSIMNEELKRLANTNKVLSEELAKFQLEIIKLNKELNSLSIENQSLHHEVTLLTQEVNRLQAILKEKE